MDALPDAAYVYMVRCTGGQLYTGWTNHPAARLKAHQSGKGARYTRAHGAVGFAYICLLYTSPSPRDRTRSRMPSSA